jgi:aspartate carbamoyltransferase catalytic subunit
MGGQVTLVGPPTLIPPEAPGWGAVVSHDLDSVLPKLDVCYMLRVQRERQRQQFFPSVREYARR